MHQLFKDEKAESEVFPKIIDWIFDLQSKKNEVKWAVTAPFKLNVFSKWSVKIKYIIYVLIPLVIALIIKLRKLAKNNK